MATEKLDAALALAKSGLAVGPLNGKAPMLPHGVKDFSTSTAMIHTWWGRDPDANIGARPAEGMIVLDVDPRNGGFDTIRPYGKIPKTVTTKTGSGGYHFWFKHALPLKANGTLGPGVDIKTCTGYLVMPPSIHPKTGKPYIFRQEVPWDELPVLPEAYVKDCYKIPAPPRPVAPRIFSNKRAQAILNRVAQAQEGERNSLLYWGAKQLSMGNLGHIEDLHEVGLELGLSEQETMSTINSAVRG